jgi:hypothetical protein
VISPWYAAPRRVAREQPRRRHLLGARRPRADVAEHVAHRAITSAGPAAQPTRTPVAANAFEMPST